MYGSQTETAAGKGHDPSCTCKNVGQQGEVLFLWQFVIVRTLMCYGGTLKVLRWRKLIGALENKLQTLHDYMNNFTVEWIHKDRCSLHVWLELNLQRECDSLFWLEDLFVNSAVQFLPFHFVTSWLYFITSLSHHLVFLSFHIVLSSSLLQLSPRHAHQFIIILTTLRNRLT